MLRREFIRCLQAVAAAPTVGPLSVLLGSCAPGGVILNVTAANGRVVIPESDLSTESLSTSYARVYIDESRNPIYVFKDANGAMVALSGICSHRGCTVKKLRDGFECPCHGSEYDLDGKVRTGPALNPLKAYEIKAVGNEYVLSIID